MLGLTRMRETSQSLEDVVRLAAGRSEFLVVARWLVSANDVASEAFERFAS